MASRAAVPGELGSVVRGLLLLRLACTALSVPVVLLGDAHEGVAATVLIVVLFGSLAPLLLWDRAQPYVLRHPLFLAVDLALATAFLLIAGPAAPFVLATVATALLGGLLYGWRGGALAAALLALTYVSVAGESLDEPDAAALALVFVVVCLYGLLAAAGARLRRLLRALERARGAERRALEEAASAAERLRLARELHDSVGKTLHGIQLQAHALKARAPQECGDAISAIEAGAAVASQEARALIGALRAPVPLGLVEETERLTRTWSHDTGIPVEFAADPAVEVAPEHRATILAIVAEALENVRRHARAGRVHVSVRSTGHQAEVRVVDDGLGFPSERPSQVLTAGHFGLVGMRERAAGIGATLEVDAAPGRGTSIRCVARSLEGGTRQRGAPHDSGTRV
jgi:signal transduction histidine kinase